MAAVIITWQSENVTLEVLQKQAQCFYEAWVQNRQSSEALCQWKEAGREVLLFCTQGHWTPERRERDA